MPEQQSSMLAVALGSAIADGTTVLGEQLASNASVRCNFSKSNCKVLYKCDIIHRPDEQNEGADDTEASGSGEGKLFVAGPHAL